MRSLENTKRIVIKGKIAYEILRTAEKEPTTNEELLFEACRELETHICQQCKNWQGECTSSVPCHMGFSEFREIEK